MTTLNTERQSFGARRLLPGADRRCTAILPRRKARCVNARLILLLANHVGDLAVLREALAAAREDVGAVK